MILSKCIYTGRHKASVVPISGTTEVYGYLCCFDSVVYQWCNNSCFMVLFEM